MNFLHVVGITLMIGANPFIKDVVTENVATLVFIAGFIVAALGCI